MAASNRASQLTKLHRDLKKHYEPVSPPSRPVLEHLLYACCLENATYDAADEAFARLQELYFDWNEIRVTTVSELSSTMRALPDPKTAADNLRRLLQSVFEIAYTFDLDPLRKENLGKATKTVESYDGVTPFVVSYTVQNALGGHSIPLDEGALRSLVILEIITEDEAAKGSVTGLERAIAKSKGVEFGSLLHQLGADLIATPHSTNLRQTFTTLNPTAKDRLPKRSSKKESAAAEQAAKSERKKKSAKAKSAAKKKTAGKTKKAAKKKSAAKKTQAAKKKPATKKGSTAAKKKSATGRLAKKKPR